MLYILFKDTNIIINFSTMIFIVQFLIILKFAFEEKFNLKKISFNIRLIYVMITGISRQIDQNNEIDRTISVIGTLCR